MAAPDGAWALGNITRRNEAPGGPGPHRQPGQRYFYTGTEDAVVELDKTRELLDLLARQRG